jgi:anti-sigma-K factor RskA
VFRLDGAIVGHIGIDTLTALSGSVLARRRRRGRGQWSWRRYRRPGLSLLTTADAVVAVGLGHTPSELRTERIAVIVLSEVVPESERWAVVLDSCHGLGLAVPVVDD